VSIRNDFAALRGALAAAKDGQAVACTLEIQWHTDGDAPRVQGPLSGTLTVQQHKGIPCAVSFSALDDEFDPRCDIEADYGRPWLGVFNGERCVVVPLSINGVNLDVRG